MGTHLKLERAHTAILLIDFQERLFDAMPDGPRERHAHQATILLRGASILNLPIILTEQYPRGLGPTITVLKDSIPHVSAHEKLSFSCLADQRIAHTIAALDRHTFLVAGMETHICVYQTILDLLQHGHNVHVIGDACLSRNKASHENGLALCQAAGASISNSETALFQLLGAAGTEEFKAISTLVR
jgi:nicotinamidase-related amidase